MKRILKSQKNKKPSCKRAESCTQDKTSTLAEIKNLLLALLADASVQCVRYQLTDYTRDVATLNKRLDTEGIGFATLTLPLLATGLFEFLETGKAIFPGFKLQAGRIYPRFLKGLFYIACEDGHSTEAEQVDAINCIYQIAVICKKLHGPFKRTKIKKQFKDFVEVDVQMGNVFESLEEEDFQTLQLCRYYIGRDFKDLDYSSPQYMPRPGPGATRTKTEKNLRYSPHVLYDQHQESYPYGQWFYSHPWDTDYFGNFDEAGDYRRLLNKRQSKPRARMKYVRKYYGKGRGICIEENESQWLQQSLAACLRDGVLKAGLAGHIEFSDQSINAKKALKASSDLEDATIDMSEASDRVARDNVSWAFQDNCALHNALMSLSTRIIDPPLEVNALPLHTNKYAAMGSGLCFPVMGIMHYYLIKAIVMRVHHVDIGEKLYVYGDDIVLPSQYAATVFERLPKFGMKLNRTKSFVVSKFRESCGLHAYNGRVITPVFLRKTFNTGSPDALASHFATESLLFLKGMKHSAKCLRDRAHATVGQMPYVPSDSPVVGWKRPTDVLDKCDLSETGYIIKTRWDRNLQCYEHKVQILVQQYDEPIRPPRENHGLLRWFAQTPQSSHTHVGDEFTMEMQGRPLFSLRKWTWRLASACH